jgi:hypothetical protein
MAIVPPLYSRINLKELIRGVIYLRVLSFGLSIDEIGKSSPGTTTISTRWQLF